MSQRTRSASRALVRSCLGVAAFALLRAAAAPACDSSGCLLVTRGQNGLLPRGTWRLDVSFRGTDQDVFLAGRRGVDRVLRPKVDFESGRLIPGYHDEFGGGERFVQLDVAYGLTRRVSVLASVPLFARRSYEVAHAPLFEQYTTEGNGDALLGVRYDLRAAGLVAGLALKAPTGRHRLVSPNRGAPGILDPMLQPGSGSVDVVLSLTHARRLAGVDWTLNASYQVNTTNDLGYRFGNEAIGGVSAGRGLWRGLAGTLQVKAFHKGRHRFDRADVPSTGLTIVYATPGLRLAAGRAASVYGFVQLPVFRYVNESQLAPRVGYLLGVSRTF